MLSACFLCRLCLYLCFNMHSKHTTLKLVIPIPYSEKILKGKISHFRDNFLPIYQGLNVDQKYILRNQGFLSEILKNTLNWNFPLHEYPIAITLLYSSYQFVTKKNFQTSHWNGIPIPVRQNIWCWPDRWTTCSQATYV